MKQFVFLLNALIAMSVPLLAQKRNLSNTETYILNWEMLNGGYTGITPDGKFMYYAISGNSDNPVIIISNLNGRRDTITRMTDGLTCTKDSRYLVYRMLGDSVVKYDLVRKTSSYIPEVAGWQMVSAGNNEYLLISAKNQQLQISNIATNKSLIIDSVKYHVLSGDKSEIAVVSNKGLSLVSFADLKQQPISEFNSVSGITFDASATKLFFYVREENKTACIYDRKTNQLRTLFNENSTDITDGYKLGSSQPQFTRDGRNLVFIFQKKEEVLKGERNASITSMEIWNYKEIWHAKEFIGINRSIAFINVEDPAARLTTVASGFVKLLETVSDPNTDGNHKNNSLLYIVVKHEADDRLYYNRDRMPDFLLYSVQDKKSVSFVPKSHFVHGQQITFSPSGRFASWYDKVSRDYYFYDITNGKVINTTVKIDVPNDLVGQADGSPSSRLVRGFPTWSREEKWFMIRDKYDLWQVDPTGVTDPINLTGGYGRKHKIHFRTIHEEIQSKELKNGTKLMVVAMDEDKRNGFASIILGSSKGFEMGKLENKLFYWTDSETMAGTTIFRKAKFTNDYLVSTQRADEAPNLYHTKDFKQFTRLSDLHPQKQYNWLTSSLVRYPMQGGKTGQCIVYKPENFDPQKKYPVLFTYYQERNYNLHCFPDPNPDVNINIPCYVSNGYIVVVPDIINDEPGKIAQTTVNSVKSAADYLKQYSWFDYSKMGIQGQSFGGYETNLLVTNTDIFAAAQASDAPSSQTAVGQFFGSSSYTFVERGQSNLGVTLWENPSVYIDNSPIFKADKVKTPLLLLHGRLDKAVDFNQAEAMYYSLQRLNKPVWLIIYDGADHATFGEGNGRQDFNIRRQQFFDHYLKGAPMPLWMKQETLSLDIDNEALSNK